MNDKTRLIAANENGCFPKWLKNGKIGTYQGKKIWYGLNSKGETVGFYSDMTAYNFKTKKSAKWKCQSISKPAKTTTSGPVDFKDATIKVINKFEGGYYNPRWHKSSGMGDSGETMFGIDRKHGIDENYSPAAKKFWTLIDKNKSRKVWKHYHRGGELETQLTELAAEIMQSPFRRNMNDFFTPQAKKIVENDYNLTFNFIYATWNGSLWFKRFASVINEAVSDGITDPRKLIKMAIKKRLNSGNKIIIKTGRKMSEVLGINVA